MPGPLSARPRWGDLEDDVPEVPNAAIAKGPQVTSCDNVAEHALYNDATDATADDDKLETYPAANVVGNEPVKAEGEDVQITPAQTCGFMQPAGSEHAVVSSAIESSEGAQPRAFVLARSLLDGSATTNQVSLLEVVQELQTHMFCRSCFTNTAIQLHQKLADRFL